MKEKCLDNINNKPLFSNDGGLDYQTDRNVVLDSAALEGFICQIPFQQKCVNNREFRTMVGRVVDTEFRFFEEKKNAESSRMIFVKIVNGITQKGVVINNLMVGPNIGFEGLVTKKAVEKFIAGFVTDANNCENFFSQGDK